MTKWHALFILPLLGFASFANSVLDAVKDFSPIEGQTVISYHDKVRNCLAVDAEKFKDQAAKVETTFKGESGQYMVKLTALLESDGESRYRIVVNNRPIAWRTNPASQDDFLPTQHEWKNVTLTKGQKLGVWFTSETNGDIPENGGTAYARGRWTNLTLTKIK